MKKMQVIPDNIYWRTKEYTKPGGGTETFQLVVTVAGKEIEAKIEWESEQEGYDPAGAGCIDTVQKVTFDLRGLGIKDASDIEGLDTIERIDVLWLDDNQITDLEPFIKMPWVSSIKELRIWNNAITSIPDLSAFTNLENLEIGKNKIRKIEGIAHSRKLKRIILDDNEISSIGIAEFRNQDKFLSLGLSNNLISELPDLTEMKIAVIHLGGNFIQKIDTMMLKAIKEKRITVYLDKQIWDTFF
jgi:hypothetical protein